MKKILVPIALALATLTFSAPPNPASAATIYVKACGVTKTGWHVGARIDDPLRYNTPCRFAWATYRKVRAKQRSGPLPWHFWVKVGKYRRECKVVRPPGKWEIRCKDIQYFVVLSHAR